MTYSQPLLLTNDGRGFRERNFGEKIAGVSFVLPLCINTVSTVSSNPVDVGMIIWEANEFEPYEIVWQAVVSQINRSGTGVLELYNYTDNNIIDSLNIESEANMQLLSKTVILPGVNTKIIGVRIYKNSSGGRVVLHSSILRIRE